ncbi:helix-turn-helix domain-containing protein [Croceimicrobium sp.]|uniref:helix-turn-helix domain-containing protein n=1 Tax=Croceimicrobium sp. TaxID=2828340 RepID=UPI003BAAEA10
MEVICLQTEAFYALVDELYERLKEKEKFDDKWVDGEEAMRLLNVKSKTTMQSLRDEGKVRFSQPQPRIILYDRDSINDYLEKHAKETF